MAGDSLPRNPENAMQRPGHHPTPQDLQTYFLQSHWMDTHQAPSGYPESFQTHSWDSYPQNYQGSSQQVSPQTERAWLAEKADSEFSRNNIFISGLKSTATDSDLVTMCACFGAIASAKAIVDPDLGHCKGYGFVMFESDDSAAHALDTLLHQGWQVAYARAPKNAEELHEAPQPDPTNLYISCIPSWLDEKGIVSLIRKYLQGVGDVTSCRVLRERDGRSRGVALARLSSSQSCDIVIQSLNGFVIRRGEQPMRVKRANGPPLKKAKPVSISSDPGMSYGGMELGPAHKSNSTPWESQHQQQLRSTMNWSSLHQSIDDLWRAEAPISSNPLLTRSHWQTDARWQIPEFRPSAPEGNLSHSAPLPIDLQSQSLMERDSWKSSPSDSFFADPKTMQHPRITFLAQSESLRTPPVYMSPPDSFGTDAPYFRDH